VFYGSGWLLNDTTLVTAGHCVYSEQGYLRSVKIWIGFGSPKEYQDHREFRVGVCVATPVAWIQGESRHDVAFIKFWEPFTAAAPLPYMETPLRGKLCVTVAGYPEDSLPYMQKSSGMLDWNLKKSGFKLLYKHDTYGGNSGSPVLISKNDNSGFIAIGVHVRGGPYDHPGAKYSESGLVNHASIIGHGQNGNDFAALGCALLLYANDDKVSRAPPKSTETLNASPFRQRDILSRGEPYPPREESGFENVIKGFASKFGNLKSVAAALTVTVFIYGVHRQISGLCLVGVFLIFFFLNIFAGCF